MGALPAAVEPQTAFTLRVERDDGARLWIGRVDGIPGEAGYASTLSALLQQMAGAVYDLAERHGKPEWLEWHGSSLPHHMRGDYW